MLDKKRNLLHLPLELLPTDSGSKSKHLSFLKYLNNRREFLEVDVFSINYFHAPRWTLEQRREVLKYVEDFYVYEGENNLLDYVYSRVKSFYHQKILHRQLPVDTDYFTPPGYIRFVQSIVSQHKYDFIWINELDYAYLALKSLKYPIHVILDVVDLRSKLRLVQKNIYPFVGLKFDYTSNLKREIELMTKFDTIVITSQEEMTLVKPSIPSHKLHLIPYTVEITDAKQPMISYQSRIFKYDLLFVGTHYAPNAEGINFFLNSILPIIIREQPNIKLAIVGKVVELLQLDPALNQNVFCLGFIPDLAEVYLTSKLVICPLLSGSGTKIKLQEAMTYAIPIVTTRTGASGLSLKDGINAFIADEPELYAQRILNLLKEPKLAQKLSEEVALTFESEYSNSAIYSKLDAMLGI